MKGYKKVLASETRRRFRLMDEVEETRINNILKKNAKEQAKGPLCSKCIHVACTSQSQETNVWSFVRPYCKKRYETMHIIEACIRSDSSMAKCCPHYDELQPLTTKGILK